MLLRSVTLWAWLTVALPIFLATIDSWEVPRTWTPGELVTALMMNRHVRDNLSSLKSNHFLRQTFRGLHLRTHPDANLFDDNVYLVHADEIVMDDGVRVGPWDNLTANKNIAGAGGLDTGAEVASTWYSIYAIRKSSDGTKNLLLHREPNYFQDGMTSGEDGQHGLWTAATTNVRLAQGFKVTTTGRVDYADLKLVRVGTVTGRFWVTIEGDSAGLPSGTVLATSDALDVAGVNATAHLVRLIFRSPATLTAGTQYHLVLRSNIQAGAVDHLAWRADTTAATYGNGSKAAFDGTTWTADADDDFVFLINTRLNDTAVAMPFGYDQKALIGFVRNDAGLNFVPFIAMGREVKAGGVVDGTVATAVPQLMDYTAGLPPRPVIAHIAGFSSVADDFVRVNPVPEHSAGSLFYIQMKAVGAANDFWMGSLATETQALYVLRTSGTGNATARLRGYKW